MIKYQRVLDQRVPRKASRKKGPAATLAHFQSVPHDFQSVPRGTIWMYTSRECTHIKIFIWGGVMGPYEMYTNRAAQPEIVSSRAYCPLGHVIHPGIVSLGHSVSRHSVNRCIVSPGHNVPMSILSQGKKSCFKSWQFDVANHNQSRA